MAREGRRNRIVRILVTNDDGIRAPGLLALCDVLLSLGHKVSVIAPSRDQSGRSQAVSIQTPVRAHRDFVLPGLDEAFAVEGTPADCVRIHAGLLDELPELVMSGINHGANLGADVFRSGTVGAAREAVLAGLPAVALSALSEVPSPGVLRCHVPEAAYLAIASPGFIINVNFPVLPNLIRVLAPLSTNGYRDDVAAHEVEDGVYDVSMHRTLAPEDAEITDLRAAFMGYVSVSRLPVRDPAVAPSLAVSSAVGRRG